MTVPMKLEDTAHGGLEFNGTSSLKTAFKSDLVTIEEYSDLPLPTAKIPGTHLKTILPEDDKTSDDWVPRDPAMIRLTGRHPFNSECPPSNLMEHYITSPELHYVRNHGAVPKVSLIQFSCLSHDPSTHPVGVLSFNYLFIVLSVSLASTTNVFLSSSTLNLAAHLGGSPHRHQWPGGHPKVLHHGRTHFSAHCGRHLHPHMRWKSP